MEFCSDNDSDFLGLIGGFAAGKTKAFCYKTVILAGLNAGYEGAIAEPTERLVSTHLVPNMIEVLEDMGIPYDLDKSHNIFHMYFKEGTTKVYCLSGENWQRLVAYNLAFFGSDETDTSSQEIASQMMKKAISRVRKGRVLQIYTTSTPEGLKYLYGVFVEKPSKEGTLKKIMGVAPGTDEPYVREHIGTITVDGEAKTYRSIHATSYENPTIERSFISSMKVDYTAEQWKVWALGQFGNLNSHRVFHAFDREKNNAKETINDFPRSEAVHVGMDFNVGQMAGIIHIITPAGLPIAVDEICKVRDTPAMIAELRKRYTHRPIIVYPDASGKSENTVGLATNHTLLRDAGFKIVVDPSNPAVGDRINSTNAMFLNATGERRYLINTSRCPVLTSALEKQAWNKGSHKDDINDHPTDAASYFIHKVWPLRGRPTLRTY